MNLSDKDRAAVEEHIRAKMPKMLCQGCGEKDWSFPGIVALPTSIEASKPGVAIPAVTMICRRCGAMQFIHALGIRAFIADSIPDEKGA
jgi:hypothetical protein